jgi:lipopolysaccharide transport system permease protein
VVTVIEPARRLRLVDLPELWRYRELLGVLARRDIKVRYRQTLLGAVWAVLQPALQALLFTLVFGRLLRAPAEGQPYALFAFVGLWPWLFFAGAVDRAASSLVASAPLVSKAYFPRLVLPLAALGTSLVDLFFSGLALAGLLAWFGVMPSVELAWLPLLVAATALLAFAVGTLFSALIVTYRDLAQVLRFGLTLWMYATPVVYSSTLLPDTWRGLSYLNPMTGLVNGYRAALLGSPVDPSGILVSLAVGVVLLVMALLVFNAAEDRFADII